MKQMYVFQIFYLGSLSGRCLSSGRLNVRFDNEREENSAATRLNDAVHEVMSMRNHRKLPGLPSGRWDGPIIVIDADGTPQLIAAVTP